MWKEDEGRGDRDRKAETDSHIHACLLNLALCKEGYEYNQILEECQYA